MATSEKTREMLPADEVDRLLNDRVAAAVAERTEQMKAEFAVQMEAQFAELMAKFTPQGASNITDKGAMEALAMAISSVNDQEIGKRRVPPEVLAKRIRAREEMETLILKTLERGIQPAYTLTKKCFVGERIVEPYWVDRATRTARPTEVGWWDVPNEYMHPINDEARAIHHLFLQSVDSVAKRDPSVRITPGGLTVRSGGLNPDGGHGQAPSVGRDRHQPSLQGRNGDRPIVETRVLGTLMPPAQQMV